MPPTVPPITAVVLLDVLFDGKGVGVEVPDEDVKGEIEEEVAEVEEEIEEDE